MRNYRRWSQAIFTAFLLMLVGVAWIVFAPYQVGGSVGYVLIQGNSMEPLFHTGDLALVRRVEAYRVGDIAAYYNGQIHRPVFHRIIALQGGNFEFKGDHNTWNDSYQPTQDEIIGRLWVTIPRVGWAVQWMRRPAILAVLAGVGGLVLMSTQFKPKRDRSGKKAPASAWFDRLGSRLRRAFLPGTGQDPTGKTPRSGSVSRLEELGLHAGLIEALFFVFGFVAFLSLAAGIFAWLHPLTVQTIVDNRYEQQGAFLYTAAAPAGIYDTNEATTGQPIFPGLSCRMMVRFDYSLSGDDLQQVAGTYRLEALVRDEHSGWQRTLPLHAETAFRGNSFTSRALLDVCMIETLAADMEAKTDLHPGVYSLYIIPQVSISGQAHGQAFTDTFAPELTFQFDPRVVYLVNGDPAVDPLHPTRTGDVQSMLLEANAVPLFGLKLGVARLRAASAWGLGLSLAGLLALLLVLNRLAGRSRAAAIQIKYGSLLIEGGHGKSTAGSHGVREVAGFDGLAKLAERLNLPILHECIGKRHHYWLEAGPCSYHFQCEEDPAPSPRKAVG